MFLKYIIDNISTANVFHSRRGKSNTYPNSVAQAKLMWPLDAMLSFWLIFLNKSLNLQWGKKYLVSHQLCKFSHLKRWERTVIFIIGTLQLWQTKWEKKSRKSHCRILNEFISQLWCICFLHLLSYQTLHPLISILLSSKKWRATQQFYYTIYIFKKLC